MNQFLIAGAETLCRGLMDTLGLGSVNKLQRMFDESPDVTTLVLNSDGGRGAIAEELALRIRQRHLNTFVEDHCLSACTYLFLAGIKRELAEDADLGFQSGSVSATGSPTGCR